MLYSYCCKHATWCDMLRVYFEVYIYIYIVVPIKGSRDQSRYQTCQPLALNPLFCQDNQSNNNRQIGRHRSDFRLQKQSWHVLLSYSKNKVHTCARQNVKSTTKSVSTSKGLSARSQWSGRPRWLSRGKRDRRGIDAEAEQQQPHSRVNFREHVMRYHMIHPYPIL